MGPDDPNNPPWGDPSYRPQMVMYGAGVTGEQLPPGPVPPVPGITTQPSLAELLKSYPSPTPTEQLTQLLENVTVLTDAVAALAEQVKGVQAQLTVIAAQNAKPKKHAPSPAARKRR